MISPFQNILPKASTKVDPAALLSISLIILFKTILKSWENQNGGGGDEKMRLFTVH